MGIGKSCRMFAKLDDGIIEKDTWIFSKLTCTIFEKNTCGMGRCDMTQQYQELTEQLAALVDAKWPMISNLANAAALLYERLDRLNWAGFYLTDNHVLWLGPFQGKTACVRIAEGKGVCGTALQTDSVQRVEDVHKFPGHIACDAASRSEIVLPIHKNGEVIGVLDIDSPEVGRFSAEDEEGLQEVVRILERIIVCS